MRGAVGLFIVDDTAVLDRVNQYEYEHNNEGKRTDE
jgi:hypothetical protein